MKKYAGRQTLLEMSLLGNILLAPDSREIIDRLTEDDFSNNRCRAVFIEMKALADDGVAGLDEFKIMSKISTSSGVDLAFISSLLEHASISIGGVEDAISRIRDRSISLKIKKLGNEISTRISSGDDAHVVASLAIHQMDELIDRSTRQRGLKVIPLDIAEAISSSPLPAPRFIVKNFIPEECVGLIVGTGGVGKSFLTLSISAMVASGVSWGGFSIDEPQRVLLLNVEDSRDDLARRLRWTIRNSPEMMENASIIEKNLIILPARGIVGPLAQFDGKRNPQPTPAMNWLRREIEISQPKLLILDTKSRLFGLEENSNSDAAMWMSLLEGLLPVSPGMSIVIVSHISKGSGVPPGGTEQNSTPRGAKAIEDNSRFSIFVSNVSKNERSKLGLGDKGCIKIVNTKSSYCAPFPDIYLQRNENGVPEVMTAERIREIPIRDSALALSDLLKSEFPEGLSRRTLKRARGDRDREIRDSCLCEPLRAGEWESVIEYGIEHGILEEREIRLSDGQHSAVILGVN